MKMTIGEIAKAIDADMGYLSDNDLDTEITGVSFDSRQLTEGSLFVPLVAQNDGHDFIASAIANGAKATLWARDHIEKMPSQIPSLVVADTLKAFQKLAKYYLGKINPRVVAITGSNGKTTTKDMIAGIISQGFNVTKTFDNFNNEIGVPYTILQMEPNTEFLVVELGMDRPGQLDYLSKLVEPDIAIITMIGEAHIEFFKTRDRIADAKMEITHGLKEDGYFIYDGDEPLLRQRAQGIDVEKATFGRGMENDGYSIDIDSEKFATKFNTNLLAGKVVIPMMGEYNVNNALAAILVGQIVRIPDEEIIAHLQDFELTKNRTEWIIGAKGEQILSDVYNSNPTAAKQVLTAFEATPTNGHRYAVLGDMLELGSNSKKMHISLKDSIDPDKIREIYLIGSDMLALADALTDKFQPQQIHYYRANELAKLAEDLNKKITPADELILKASHGIHLEKVLNDLK